MSTRLASTVALALAGRLAFAPVVAADPPSRDAPIRTAATREAARLASATPRGPMPPGLKWTGVSLLAGSTLPVGIAVLGDCVPDEFACRDQKDAALVAAGVMAGTGVLLLIIAHAKRPAALPDIAVGPGRAAIVQRIRF
jgi:hypothetical protein